MARPADGDTSNEAVLVDRIEAALPQTQCTRCGFPDCRSYAAAIASGEARINRCPPGGAEGIARLAAVTGAEVVPLDPERGTEKPRVLAIIDEAWCIGCTLCIKACPVDCIIGAPKLMHSVIDEQCNGCELCAPACPVDCIAMEPVTGTRTGWQAWSQEQADRSRQLYDARNQRRGRAAREHDLALAAKAQTKLADLASQTKCHDEAALARKRVIIEAALARAQAKAATENPPRDEH